jgi:hypothetical protein
MRFLDMPKNFENKVDNTANQFLVYLEFWRVTPDFDEEKKPVICPWKGIGFRDGVGYIDEGEEEIENDSTCNSLTFDEFKNQVEISTYWSAKDTESLTFYAKWQDVVALWYNERWILIKP